MIVRVEDRWTPGATGTKILSPEHSDVTPVRRLSELGLLSLGTGGRWSGPFTLENTESKG